MRGRWGARRAFPEDSGVNTLREWLAPSDSTALLFPRGSVQGQPRGTAGRDSPFPRPPEDCRGRDLAPLGSRRLEASSDATTADVLAHWEAQRAGVQC